MTYQAFANKYGVKLESTLIAERPDKLMGDMPSGSAHWRCVLRCGRRQMTVYYSQGPAVVGEPKVKDLLMSIALDVSGWENARDFDEWCREYGYDSDSRKAERIFKAVEKQADDLARLVPPDAYETLLWQTEESA